MVGEEWKDEGHTDIGKQIMVRSISIDSLQIWLCVKDNMAGSILRTISSCGCSHIYHRIDIKLSH